jgi:hypothetical protein
VVPHLSYLAAFAAAFYIARASCSYSVAITVAERERETFTGVLFYVFWFNFLAIGTQVGYTVERYSFLYKFKINIIGETKNERREKKNSGNAF